MQFRTAAEHILDCLNDIVRPLGRNVKVIQEGTEKTEAVALISPLPLFSSVQIFVFKKARFADFFCRGRFV
jgi:hypothetical protein